MREKRRIDLTTCASTVRSADRASKAQAAVTLLGFAHAVVQLLFHDRYILVLAV